MLRQTFKAFASDNRSTIIETLINNNKPLTFIEIKQAVNLDQRVLTDELKKLISGAVVDHYTEYRNGVRRHSYYELTEYGAKILEANLKVLFESYEPTVNSGVIKGTSTNSELDSIKKPTSASSSYNTPPLFEDPYNTKTSEMVGVTAE
jgi:DNA-binding HxlR family transcriptional regulator